MPDGFARPCPICKRALIRGATERCTDCQRGRVNLRERTYGYMYGHKWRLLRQKVLQAHPHCVECHDGGRIVRAVEVDHIRPHEGDFALMYLRSNLQPLCKRHHARKTLLETKQRKPERFTRE